MFSVCSLRPAESWNDDLQDRRLTTLCVAGKKLLPGEVAGHGMKPRIRSGDESAALCGLTATGLVCAE